MANLSGREVLRGVEVQTLDLIAEALSSEEWTELLQGPLERAARQGNRRLAQQLVEAGARIGDALHEAVRGGHGEVVNDLLENGASIDAKHAKSDELGKTPLHVAAGEGRAEMVQLLMLKGADKDAVDNDGWTPLHTVACHGHIAAALALLAGGADPNSRFAEFKKSVIQVAACEGHVDILRAAIEHGADVEAADVHQYTALHLAAEWGEAEAIDVLVGAGANIEARTVLEATPLHCACSRLSLEALAALLAHCAQVNAQTKYLLNTPLHTAAYQAGEKGAAEVVDFLLRSGADETILDHNGKTAADIVRGGVEEEDYLAKDVERVQQLLANAPADRAWRRRGYLVLCRTHPDRVQQAPESNSADADMSRRTHHGVKLRRSEPRGCDEHDEETCVDERVEADWGSAVARVLRLQEEGIFRTILGYL